MVTEPPQLGPPRPQVGAALAMGAVVPTAQPTWTGSPLETEQTIRLGSTAPGTVLACRAFGPATQDPQETSEVHYVDSHLSSWR